MTSTAARIAFAVAAVPAMFSGQTAFPVSGAACALGKDDDQGLRTIYWELNQITEICAPVETTAPLALSLVLTYTGRPPAGSLRPEARGTPQLVLLRVQARRPVQQLAPSFAMTGDGRRLDLAASGRQHQLVYPCDLSATTCGWDGLLTRLEVSELVDLSRAAQISGEALGTNFALTASGQAAVRRIAARATLR
jgi:hypothetical protein